MKPDEIYFIRVWKKNGQTEITMIYSTNSLFEQIQELEEQKAKFDVFEAKCVYDRS